LKRRNYNGYFDGYVYLLIFVVDEENEQEKNFFPFISTCTLVAIYVLQTLMNMQMS